MKGVMSSVYTEARAQSKALKERTDAAKARAEEKRDLDEAKSEHPLHYIRIDGHSAVLYRNDYLALQQHTQGLMPWNGDQDTMIDRYDVRALLDMYIPPDPRRVAARKKTAKEADLDEMLMFESYRDLIRLQAMGLTPTQALKHAQQENLELRTQARAAAEAAFALQHNRPGTGLPGTGCSTPGAFAAVPFLYHGDDAADSDSDNDHNNGDGDDDVVHDDDLAPTTAEDATMDVLAKRLCGLDEFSSMLRWAVRKEQEEADLSKRMKRTRGWGRKKRALRARRMAGQGLLPPPASLPGDLSWIPVGGAPPAAGPLLRHARDSPEYKPYPERRMMNRRRYRSRSRSPSRKDALLRRPRVDFITTFTASEPVAEDEDDEYEYKAGRNRPKNTDAKPGGGRAGGLIKQPAAPPDPAVATGRPKETPQERLKRLMAAQLEKKAAKDAASDAAKKLEEQKQQAARNALQREMDDRPGRGVSSHQHPSSRDRDRGARYPRPRGTHADSRRGRSRSPDRGSYRDRGRDRSRSRGRYRSRSRSTSRDRGRYRRRGSRSRSPSYDRARGRRY